MKVKLSVFMFMLLMVTAVPARELTQTTFLIKAQKLDYPEPRGLR
jgi:hypothetical protein